MAWSQTSHPILTRQRPFLRLASPVFRCFRRFLTVVPARYASCKSRLQPRNYNSLLLFSTSGPPLNTRVLLRSEFSACCTSFLSQPVNPNFRFPPFWFEVGHSLSRHQPTLVSTSINLFLNTYNRLHPLNSLNLQSNRKSFRAVSSAPIQSAINPFPPQHIILMGRGGYN